MKFAAVLLLATVAVAAATEYLELDAHHRIADLDKIEKHWKHGVNPRFSGKTIGYVKSLCGTNMDIELSMNKAMDRLVHNVDGTAVPDSFDSRTNWSFCPVIGKIRDQADCGSCWAFGSTEAFNDRKCIATKGAFTKMLSPQDTTSCCGFLKCFSMGCSGGQPTAAWNFFKSEGIVTGADYDSIGSNSTCWPYQLPFCGHHTNSTKYAPCPSSEVSAPKCATSCSEKAYPVSFADDKVKATSSYSVSGETQIMTEIMTNGPVTGAFTVYDDFPAYTSGVYHHVSGSALGGHAIKIIGWGVENGQKYWLVNNSWNNTWGDNGTFKILRGSDECGIESSISAGMA